MKNFLILLLSIVLLIACTNNNSSTQYSKEELEAIDSKAEPASSGVSIVLLGTIQDAGSPHIGCKKACCAGLFDRPDVRRQVVSLGVIDREHNTKYLFEATPDIAKQVKALKNRTPGNEQEIPDGIFITHAHIGHYTGLMYLGKEATNATKVPVYAMPKMSAFLRNNGPWSQLVANQNIQLRPLENEQKISLTPNLKVTPIRVPHRDEYSETVGYKINGPNKSALFIPDIDKWEKWESDIIKEIAKVDYAFLDATFFSGEEINTRDISEIPHPFIIESMEKFEGLSAKEKEKIVFIHFNHTNPVIDPNSTASKQVLYKGFQIARIYDRFEL